MRRGREVELQWQVRVRVRSGGILMAIVAVQVQG